MTTELETENARLREEVARLRGQVEVYQQFLAAMAARPPAVNPWPPAYLPQVIPGYQPCFKLVGPGLCFCPACLPQQPQWTIAVDAAPPFLGRCEVVDFVPDINVIGAVPTAPGLDWHSGHGAHPKGTFGASGSSS